MIKKSGKGYRLFSMSTGKPLGPVRASHDEVMEQDEKRVQFFKNLHKSSGGPGSLASKVRDKSLLKRVRG